MNKIKIQFIGIKNIPDNKDDEIFRIRKVKWLASGEGYSSEESLSFHDYNIVFINYSSRLPYPTEPDGFMDYIYGGGNVVLFLGPSAEYPWGNSFLEISEVNGDSIIPNQKHWLKNILKKYTFTWHCLISKKFSFSSIDNDLEIAGTTVSGKCVSSVVHYGKGKLILLPLIKEIHENLIRELIDEIKRIYFKNPEITEIRPSWIEKWGLEPELKLKTEKDIITKELNEVKNKLELNNKNLEFYESRKKILYASGRELSYSIYLIFNDMDFDPDFKEDEGRQDIEIKYNSFFAIIEAKGLTGFANNKDLRQLLEYHVDVIETNPECKAIFIVNHFRDRNPSERNESPYSIAALKLAIKNNFCLLTTIDLFKLYDLFLKNEMTKAQIIDLFQKTNGLMKLEK